MVKITKVMNVNCDLKWIGTQWHWWMKTASMLCRIWRSESMLSSSGRYLILWVAVQGDQLTVASWPQSHTQRASSHNLLLINNAYLPSTQDQSTMHIFPQLKTDQHANLSSTQDWSTMHIYPKPNTDQHAHLSSTQDWSSVISGDS